MVQNEEHLKQQIEMHRHLAEVYTEKRYAPEYSRIFQEAWNRQLCDLADLRDGAVVLDFGCGTGVLFDELGARGTRAVGIDLSLAMLRAADGTRVDRVCADGCMTPFADASFDAVLCRGSIHHLPALEQAFAEIARLLRPGGCLAFSEPSNDSIINRLARRTMYRLSEEFHERDEGFIREEIAGMLQAAGLKVEVSKGFGFLAYTFAGFPDKLDLLGKVPGACKLTRLFLRVDSVLESLPVLDRLALHWQVRARKPG